MDAKPQQGQRLEDCKDFLLSQLDSLKQGHFDENLIGAVINNLEEKQQLGFEDNNGRVSAMLPAYVCDVSWNKLMGEFDDMKKISKKDIVDFANKYFNNDYVLVYKHKGKDTTEVKLQKPVITPTKPNHNGISEFAKKVLGEPVPDIQPVFLDYKKDITVDTINHHLPLYYVKNQENNLFNIFYVFEMGTNNDKKINYALTYLQYLGTNKLNAYQISKQFYELGCNFSVQTGSSQVYVSLSGLDENMDAALQLFEDLLNHCAPDDSALHMMLKGELKSRADAKQNKNYIRTLLQEYGMYGSLNPSNNVLSNAQIVLLSSGVLTDELHALESYKHKVFYYGPRDIKTVEAIITKHHITSPKLRDYPPETKFTPVQPKANAIYFVNYDMAQADIEWVRKASDWNLQLIPIIRLFNQYFDEELFQNLREEREIAYATYTQFTIPVRKNDTHFIICDVATADNKLDSVIMALNGLMTALPAGSEQTLESSKEDIKKQIQSERIIRTDILFNYETDQRRGINYDLRKTIYDDISKLTFTDIQTLFNTYYKEKPFTYCVLGSQSKVDLTKLGQYGTMTQLNLNDIFGY
jgi:predicted Zn-dependent peptidase